MIVKQSHLVKLSNILTKQFQPLEYFMNELSLSKYGVKRIFEELHKAEVIDRLIPKWEYKLRYELKKSELLNKLTSLVKVKNEKQHVCDICDKRFNCEAHLKLHLSNRPGKYECEHCNHTFATPKALNMHVRGHIDEGENFSELPTYHEKRRCEQCKGPVEVSRWFKCVTCQPELPSVIDEFIYN